VEAQAKQAREHDKQQDDVGREADESVKSSNVWVGHYTISRSRYRFNLDLGMMNPEGLLQIRLIIHPHNG
jgi:hypothetical protein